MTVRLCIAAINKSFLSFSSQQAASCRLFCFIRTRFITQVRASILKEITEAAFAGEI